MSKLDKLKKTSIDLGKSKATARAAPRPPAHSARAVVAKSKLAAYGDPYVTDQGKVIPPEQLFEKPVDMPKASKTYRPLRKRSLQELPANPNVMKGIALVFGFTVLGLSDREIAEVCKITPQEVRQIRSHSAYGETFEIISTEFVNAKSQRLVSKIAAYADEALEKVYDIAQNGQKESNQLRASIDILDRAGVRPKDTAEMGKAQHNELRITIVKGDDTEVAVDGITIDS
jgi:hypothetical protein